MTDLAKLKARVTHVETERDSIASELAESRRVIEELEAEYLRLRAALQPFAFMYRQWRAAGHNRQIGMVGFDFPVEVYARAAALFPPDMESNHHHEPPSQPENT